ASLSFTVGRSFLCRPVVPYSSVSNAMRRSLSSAMPRPSPNTDKLFTAEHEAMRSTLRRIIEQDINPYVDEWEAKEIFPAKQLFKKLGNAGLLGVTRPVEYGGLGLDYSYSLWLKSTRRVNCGGVPMAIGVQSDMATPALARFGSHELKNNFLGHLLPEICQQLVAMWLRLRLRRGEMVTILVINGSKMWITSGMQADWMCLLANTEASVKDPYLSKSLICLPLDLPGVQRARKIRKIGMHSSDTAQLFFENVRVPASYLIGEPGQGFIYQMLQRSDCFGAAANLLGLELIIQETAEYARQRKAFGQSLLDFQTVHFRLAELLTEVELLRSMVYRATAKYVAGNDVTMLASMASKPGLVREVTDSCLQWGGMGFTDEVRVAILSLTVRLPDLYRGLAAVDEVMLSIICKYMRTLPKPPKK
uniref:Acyl-CoA_dh_1 domain-containing protein n=1 Tax=Macrostomum lignano TaxID=282301 RepID=A0A1I8FT94_9PLAT